MHIKVDEDLPRAAVRMLRDKGYQAQSVVEQRMGGYKDPALGQAVQAEQRYLVTADKGFADMWRRRLLSVGCRQRTLRATSFVLSSAVRSTISTRTAVYCRCTTARAQRFTPDGKVVLYTSDLKAYSNMYLVEVGDFDELPDLE